MNIGFFTDSYYPQVNGVTYTISAWKKELEKRGHQVNIYYPGSSHVPEDGEWEFPSIPYPFYPGYRLANPLSLPKNIKDLDVIHEHGLYSMAISGLRAVKKTGLRGVISFSTPGDPYIRYIPGSGVLSPIYRRAYLMWERVILNRFDIVTAPTHAVAERLESNEISDVKVLSLGLDLDLFHRVDSNGFKEAHDLGEGYIAGFCGRIGYEKHLEDLIAAARHFDGTIIIAGDGPAKNHYMSMAKDLDNVRFLGFIDRNDLKEFYSAIDVFAFPSRCETQGLVALEAMACGTPVVAAPVAALKETIKDGVDGLHYRVSDPVDFAQKLLECIIRKDELAGACIHKAKTNSKENTIDELIRIYEDII